MTGRVASVGRVSSGFFLSAFIAAGQDDSPDESQSREDHQEGGVSQLCVGLQQQEQRGQCGVPEFAPRPRSAQQIQRGKRYPLRTGDVALPQRRVEQLGRRERVERTARKRGERGVDTVTG